MQGASDGDIVPRPECKCHKYTGKHTIVIQMKSCTWVYKFIMYCCCTIHQVWQQQEHHNKTPKHCSLLSCDKLIKLAADRNGGGSIIGNKHGSIQYLKKTNINNNTLSQRTPTWERINWLFNYAWYMCCTSDGKDINFRNSWWLTIRPFSTSKSNHQSACSTA